MFLVAHACENLMRHYEVARSKTVEFCGAETERVVPGGAEALRRQIFTFVFPCVINLLY
jgi:hypothetical protein